MFIAAKLFEPEHDSDEDFSSAAPAKLVPIFQQLVQSPKLYERICDALLDCHTVENLVRKT